MLGFIINIDFKFTCTIADSDQLLIVSQGSFYHGWQKQKYFNGNTNGLHLFFHRSHFHFHHERHTFLKGTRVSLPLLVNLTLHLFELMLKLETVIAIFSRFWWIIYSSDPNRVWIVNLLPAAELPRPLGDETLC